MASKILQQTETATVWTDSGGDKLLDLGSMTTGTARIGAYLDLGASPRTDLYEVVVKIDGFIAAPAAGRIILVWFSQSNSTTGFDGSPSTDPTAIAEGSIGYNQSMNCLYLGVVRTVSTTPADVIQARFLVKLTGRYVSPVIVNQVGVTLNNSGDTHTITLTPVPPEAQ